MLGDDVLSSNKQPPAKYQQALMLSGGGHQYATLLGRYDALLDMGHKPDLLIASCGGSIVAHLIASIKDPQKRLDWISSKDMHRFWASQQAGPGNQIHRILFSALKRKLWNRVSTRLPDLMNTWLFRFDQSFPTLPQPLPDAPDVLIMGTQLNYQEEQIGSNSHDAIFSEVLFCNERVAALLANEAYAANGQALPFTNISNLGKGTDWQKEVFKTAIMSSADISVSKGTEKAAFNFSASYLDQDGIVGLDKSNFNRLTAKLNADVDVLENLKLTSSVIYTNTNRKASEDID